MRARREPPPPGMFGRTRSGSYFKLCLQKKRDRRGRKLYRLLFEEGVRGTQLWTIDELVTEGVRFLRRRPARMRPAPR